MLKIRLQRVGRKHETTFRIVLTDSKNSTKSGRFHSVFGSYDPRKKNEIIDGEGIRAWMAKGAQLSDTMRNLLITHKIIEGKKVNVLPRKSPPKKDEPVAEAPKAEATAAPVVDEAPKEEVQAPETVAEVKEEVAQAPEPTVEPTEIKEEEKPA